MKHFPTRLLVLLLSLACMSFAQTSLAAAELEPTGRTENPGQVATKPTESIAGTKTDERFERLGITGERIDDSEAWPCVADSRTGLVWEVKTVDGGIRDSAHSYSWFDPEVDGQAGAEDGGRCGGGVRCDTHHYRISLNQERLCGFDDWRLPTREELETLVKFQSEKSRPAIDDRFFPLAAASWYWTASSNASSPEYAWYVLFRSGVALNDLKERPKHVRLVRGGKLPVASKQ
jgi:hypothetical protein